MSPPAVPDQSECPVQTGPAPRAAPAPAFWQEADVPEPAVFREPVSIHPEDLGISQEIPDIDFPAELARLEKEEDTKVLNSLLLDWLTVNPDAARTWLEDSESLTPYQNAIAHYAGRKATDGELGLAMQWAEFVDSQEQRARLIADIYSRGFQTGSYTRDDILQAPLSNLDRQEILDGSRRN